MSPAGMDLFRKIVETRYRLLPYIYTQAVRASQAGLPLLRGLFIQYPHDPLCWTCDDAYLLGEDLIVAPLLEECDKRFIYLPEGMWIDYQTGAQYEGRRLHEITAGELPIVLLVRAGAVLPHAPLCQATAQLDWDHIELRAYPKGAAAMGWLCRPNGQMQQVTVSEE